jgi:hypothetical protein
MERSAVSVDPRQGEKTTTKSVFGPGRYGVCHCCGWKGMVGKPRRRDQRHMRSGSTYGRLCEECAVDLLVGQFGDQFVVSDHPIPNAQAGERVAEAVVAS